MRWWSMAVPLALLMSGCAQVEEVVFGDDGYFDQVVAPTVEQALTPSPSSSQTSGNSTARPKTSANRVRSSSASGR